MKVTGHTSLEEGPRRDEMEMEMMKVQGKMKMMDDG